MANTDIFDRMAATYDTPERSDIAEKCLHVLRQEWRELDRQAKQLLDFGCGTGLIGLELLSDFKEVTFIDSSKNMLDIVEKKLIHHSESQHAHLLHLDLEKEERLPSQYDVIVVAMVLLHIPDYRSMLQKLFSALTVGGSLYILDFETNPQVISDKVHSGFEQADLCQTLLDIGFTTSKSHPFYQAENLFMGQEATMFLCQGVR